MSTLIDSLYKNIKALSKLTPDYHRTVYCVVLECVYNACKCPFLLFQIWLTVDENVSKVCQKWQKITIEQVASYYRGESGDILLCSF